MHIHWIVAAVETRPGSGYLAGLASLEWFGKDDVTVVVVEYHDVIVTAKIVLGTCLHLVGVGFL